MIKNILKLKYLILIISVLVIFGCVETPDPVVVVDPPKPVVPTDEGVTRVIANENVNVGDNVNVKLYINLNADKTYYVAEEEVPMEFEVLDKEAGDDNHLKMINIQNPTNRIYEYNVRATQAGTFTFAGVYAFDGLEDPVQIMGQKTVTVQ